VVGISLERCGTTVLSISTTAIPRLGGTKNVMTKEKFLFIYAYEYKHSLFVQKVSDVL
jgi:hypothetical protein